MKFAEMYFAVPWGPSFAPSTPTSASRSKADRDQVEDTAYLYLYASGMDLEKAKKIRRKAGFVT
jgi:hypothetical protein